MQEPHDPNTPGAHDAPTDPATAVTPPPAPVRASLARRMARYGLWAALGLLMVLALALGGLWFWSATDESLNTLLRLVQRHMPAGSSLQVEGVSGSLRRGGHIDKLVYRLNDTGRNPENHAENAERTGENAGALPSRWKTPTSPGTGPPCAIAPPSCATCMCAPSPSPIRVPPKPKANPPSR